MRQREGNFHTRSGGVEIPQQASVTVWKLLVWKFPTFHRNTSYQKQLQAYSDDSLGPRANFSHFLEA